MVKTYVLDTNILLSDPKALFSFEENIIILPFIVLEELDRHKDRSDLVGANARETTRQLSKLTKNPSKSLLKGIELPTGGVLKVLPAEHFEYVTMPEELKDDRGDNYIIKVCLGLKECILVSNDLLLRIKANSLGIKNEEYRKLKVVVSSETLYSGTEEIRLTEEQVQEYYETKDKTEFIKKLAPKGNPNQFFILKTDDGITNLDAVKYPGKDGLARVIDTGDHNLYKIKPRNKEQALAIDLLMDDSIKLVTVVGMAGTGKTLCVLSAALEQVLNRRKYDSLVICRPVQPVGKDIGFLPGTKEEKLEPWIAPIKDNLKFLIGATQKTSMVPGKKKTTSSKSAFDERNETNRVIQDYFESGIIEVEALTYIRGRSIANAFIIIDEAQNLSAHELKTIVTRVGDGTKIVLTGDIEQIDNMYVDSVSNGLSVAIEKFKNQEIAGHITLTKGERSELASISAKIL